MIGFSEFITLISCENRIGRIKYFKNKKRSYFILKMTNN